ncbi:hypothetical protein H4582DRAFT_1908546 [Lactarius indigo]|nr:hypothetical protein H4582DRAFT_1908546 [Lactarius indigo]
MSRRRARRSYVSPSATPEDTHASQKVPNRTLQLPTELVYTILAISIGEYLSDLMLYPSKIERWDATLTFLHVSHTFRGCTIKLLYHLWGDTFIRERTRFPLSFTSRDDKPKLLSARVVRHPISPLARIWSAFIRNTAAANAVLLDAENDRIHVDFEDVYVAEDLQTITDSYAEIPAGIRSQLLGRVMHRVMTQAAIWTKLKALSATVSSVFRLLTLLVEAGGQIEIHSELPRITEDNVAQVSFSLTVEDIPPMLAKHVTAVGLDMVESEGALYVELCQMMRSYIASYLTDTERARYLR